MPETFGDRLETLLGAQKKAKQRLADAVGVSLSTVQRWTSQQGKQSYPQSETVRQRIADAMGVRLEYLETGQEPVRETTRENTSAEPDITYPTVRRPKRSGGLHPAHEAPGRYVGLQEVASSIVWEMRDGDDVIYAVRVTTYVAPTKSVDATGRVETPPASPQPKPQQGRSAA